jgi:hypothetical protein
MKKAPEIWGLFFYIKPCFAVNLITSIKEVISIQHDGFSINHHGLHYQQLA